MTGALSNAEASTIRRDTIKRLVAFLSRNARNPARVGRRVILLDFLLHRGETGAPNCKTLARRLGVSQSRVSIALADLEYWLFELQKVKTGGLPEKSD